LIGSRRNKGTPSSNWTPTHRGRYWPDAAQSHDIGGKGRLRFFAIDASALSTTPSAEPKQEPAPVAAADPWKDCQSTNAETRLAGCTKMKSRH